MLKNKPKSVGQFIIDLTPLLDVVFILLIIVLSALGTARNKAAEQQGNGNGSVAVDDQPDTNMYEYVDMVSIFAAYDPLNRKEREVYVVINGDSKDNLSLSGLRGNSMG